MKKLSKSLKLHDKKVTISIRPLTGELSVLQEGKLLVRTPLWKPYQNIRFDIDNQPYRLKIVLFPLNLVRLLHRDQVIVKEVFPRYRAFSLISFVFGLIRKLVLVVASVFS